MRIRFQTILLLALLTISLISCGSESHPPGAPTAIGTATISGTIRYEDREYSGAGFTGRAAYFKAVRYGKVEIVDEASGSVLGSAVTDANGYYSQNVTLYGPALYARILCQAELAGAPLVNVNDLSGALYAVATASVSVSDKQVKTIDLTVDRTNYPAVAGAFNILDVIIIGYEFVYTYESAYPPVLNVYWTTGNKAGTYYCTGCSPGDGIYVLNDTGIGGTGDTDEYDDDVLLHEFGHFLADKFSKNDSLGGYHYLGENDQDLRLSWSEGWGDFLPCVIKRELAGSRAELLSTTSTMLPTEYVDTLYDSANIHFDFGNPGTSTGFLYSSSEVAIAKVLWDTSGSYEFSSVWDVFTSLKTASSPVNLERFWDLWLTRPTSSGELATMNNILRGRSILYEEDLYELDSNASGARTVNLNQQETHTLYVGGDIDYIAFSASASTSYTIESYDLANGADTFLTLFDRDATTVLVTNDNYATVPVFPRNGPLTLASLISFSTTSQSAGTYYVRVSTSPSLPQSAGRFGTYSLVITSP